MANFLAATGAGHSREINGKTYTFQPPTGKDLGELVSRYAAKTRKHLENALKDAQADIKTKVELLMQHDITADGVGKVVEYAYTVAGCVDIVTVCCKKTHSELKEEDVQNWPAEILFEVALILVGQKEAVKDDKPATDDKSVEDDSSKNAETGQV